MKEVRDKRYAGPFSDIPCNHFIQSPIGLVPKDRVRILDLYFTCHILEEVHHQSITILHLKAAQSNYPDFNEAIQLCIKAGKG